MSQAGTAPEATPSYFDLKISRPPLADSISWRRFARIPLDGRVPHPTTLMKITTRCGESAVAGLNEALLAKAATGRLPRVGRIRADTTVIPANVAYPTDSGLLAKAVGKIARTVRRVQAAGGATRTRIRDRRRAAGRRMRQISARLRSRAVLAGDESTAAIARITGDLAGLAETTAAEAAAVLRNCRRALHRIRGGRIRGRLRRALDELATTPRAAGACAAAWLSRPWPAAPHSTRRPPTHHTGW
jgi:transposase, IS5 family